MTKFEMMEILIENLGAEQALAELVEALSDYEMKDNFAWICRMKDIEQDEEENEE